MNKHRKSSWIHKALGVAAFLLYMAESASAAQPPYVDTYSAATSFATLVVGEQPVSLFVDKTGNVYSGYDGAFGIKKFDSSGTLVNTFTGITARPFDITQDSVGNTYAIMGEPHSSLKCNAV